MRCQVSSELDVYLCWDLNQDEIDDTEDGARVSPDYLVPTSLSEAVRWGNVKLPGQYISPRVMVWLLNPQTMSPNEQPWENCDEAPKWKEW